MRYLDRIIGFDTQLLIQMGIQFLNTTVCVSILYGLLYKPVRKFMVERSRRIENEISQASDNLKKAQELKAEYELKLKNIEAQQKEMLDLAHKQAIEDKDLIINSAKQEALRIRKQTQLDIDRQKEQLKDELKKQVINISWVIASDFLKENLTDELQNTLAKEALAKMESQKW